MGWHRYWEGQHSLGNMSERNGLGFGVRRKAARSRLSLFQGGVSGWLFSVVFGEALPWPEGHSLGPEMGP